MSKKEMEIKLKTPVVIEKEGQESKTYTVLILRRFKAKHLRFLPDEMLNTDELTEAEIIKNPGLGVKMATKAMPLIASLAQVDEEVIGELEVEDLVEVFNNLGPFLSKFQSTGKSASGQ